MKGRLRPNGTSLYRPIGGTLNPKGNAKTMHIKVSDKMFADIERLAIKHDVFMATVVRCSVKIALRRLDVLEAMLEEEHR